MELLIDLVGLVLFVALMGAILLVRPGPAEMAPTSRGRLELGRPGTATHLLAWMYRESARVGRAPPGGWRAYVRRAYADPDEVSQRQADRLLSELVTRGLLERQPRGWGEQATYALPEGRAPEFIERVR